VARFYEVTKGPATGLAAKFIAWIDTSKAARKIISNPVDPDQIDMVMDDPQAGGLWCRIWMVYTDRHTPSKGNLPTHVPTAPGPIHRAGHAERTAQPWPDHRAERLLGAVSLCACFCVLFMVAFVAVRAWPTFEHNGLSWLGPGGSLSTQVENMLATSTRPPASAFHLRAWPIVYGTLLITTLAAALALPLAVPSAIFIVDLPPAACAA
jgi:hypothetical protein